MEIYTNRLSLIWKSLLSGPCKIRATNSFCVPILTFGFGVIPRTKLEISQMDVITRKVLTTTGNHHPHSAIERLYLPRDVGGLGLIKVEDLYYRRLVSIACHLYSSADKLVNLCCELDNVLPSRCSIISRAKEYFSASSVLFDPRHL